MDKASQQDSPPSGRLSYAVTAARIWLKLVLKTVLFVPGWFWRKLRPPRPAFRVLFYHRVNPYSSGRLGPVSREITVRPEAFSAQLAHLRDKGYRSLPLSHLIPVLAGKKLVDPRTILITFDDGYEDNLLWAVPLLKEYGYQGLVFVATNFVGKETADLWAGADTPGFGRFLTWNQIRQLRQEGMAIGSHTCSHSLLTKMSPSEIRQELRDSRRTLSSRLDEDIRFFAYPVGDFDSDVEKEVTAAGYSAAFTTVPGTNAPGTPITALRRTEVSASDSFFVFKMKILGALDWLWFKESAAFRKLTTWPNRWLLR